MSSNIGSILSMIIVMGVMLLGGDLMCLSASYSSLDNASNTIGYLISKTRRTDNEYLSSLENKYNVIFDNISSQNPTYGEVVDFTIYRLYNPIIMSASDIKLTVKRSTVIGYYG